MIIHDFIPGDFFIHFEASDKEEIFETFSHENSIEKVLSNSLVASCLI